jgi:hypothetical protein
MLKTRHREWGSQHKNDEWNSWSHDPAVCLPSTAGCPGREQLMEKRNIKRQGIDASTVCSHFATSKNTNVYDAKMLNYSEGGMCIESNADFKKGTIVLVKVRALFSNAGYPSLMEAFRTVSLGEIKWSKPSHDVGKALFGISTSRLGGPADHVPAVSRRKRRDGFYQKQPSDYFRSDHAINHRAEESR